MISEAVYLHYFSALQDGDRETCAKIVDELLEKEVKPKDIYVNLFQKSMYRIGDLWDTSRYSIGAEHISTKITESIVGKVLDKYKNSNSSGKTILISCLDKEFHELGARIVSDFFEIHGWKSLFLGANTPKEEVLSLIETRNPDVVGISNNFYMNIPRLIKLVSDVKERFPEKKLIIGGQSLNFDGKSDLLKSFSDIKYLSDLDKVEEYIEAVSS